MRYSRCRLMITRKPDNTDYLPLSLVMFHSSDECSLILVHTGPVISSRLRDSSPAAFACRLETYTAMRTILCRDKTVNTSVTPVRETLGGSHRDIANPIVIFGPSRAFFLLCIHMSAPHPDQCCSSLLSSSMSSESTVAARPA